METNRRCFVNALLALAIPGLTFAQQVTLDPKTLADYKEHLAKVESEIKSREASTDLVWTRGVENLAARLQQGELIANPSSDDGDIDIHGGVIHDWAGVVFVPHTTLAKTLDLVRDYSNYATYYAPDVASAEVIGGSGDQLKVRMRLVKKVMFTLVFNAEFDVGRRRINDERTVSSSTCTRMAEVEKAGTPEEKELPEGTGSGMLWRVDNYFAFTERDGGVYFEMRSVSLSNPLPGAMSFARPLIVKIPRQSLVSTLEATRKALTRP